MKIITKLRILKYSLIIEWFAVLWVIVTLIFEINKGSSFINTIIIYIGLFGLGIGEIMALILIVKVNKEIKHEVNKEIQPKGIKVHPVKRKRTPMSFAKVYSNLNANVSDIPISDVKQDLLDKGE